MGLIEDAIKLVLSAVRTFSDATRLKEFKKLRDEIFVALEYYSNVDTSIGILSRDHSPKWRKRPRKPIVSLLLALSSIRIYPSIRCWGFPRAEYLEIAKANLVQLSRESGKPEAAVANYDRQANVREALKTTWGARKIKKRIAL